MSEMHCVWWSAMTFTERDSCNYERRLHRHHCRFTDADVAASAARSTNINTGFSWFVWSSPSVSRSAARRRPCSLRQDNATRSLIAACSQIADRPWNGRQIKGRIAGARSSPKRNRLTPVSDCRQSRLGYRAGSSLLCPLLSSVCDLCCCGRGN